MGATPVTLPIELVGTSSVRIRLEKPGYDNFEQTITGSDPISISLSPVGGQPTAVPDAGTSAAPRPHHHHRPAAKPTSDEAPEPEPAPGPADDSD
jgi:hypothetical protein